MCVLRTLQYGVAENSHKGASGEWKMQKKSP